MHSTVRIALGKGNNKLAIGKAIYSTVNTTQVILDGNLPVLVIHVIRTVRERPRAVLVLQLIPSLERHGHIEQIDIVLVVVQYAVEELEDDVEGHLDGDGFASVVRSRDEHRGSLVRRLRARLQFDERDVPPLVRLPEAAHGDQRGELAVQLVDDHQ